MPRLSVHWQGRGANFRESLGAALFGPRPSRRSQPSLFGRFRTAPGRLRARGIAGSFAWHAILLSISFPISRLAAPAPKISLPQIEITWYGPITDVAPVDKPPAKRQPPKPEPKLPADHQVITRAYNPDTTVIFNPPRPSNTRQILIEPDAPPNEPIFLPPLPNIIHWAAASAQPSISIEPGALKAAPTEQPVAAMLAPNLVQVTPPPGPLNIVPDPNAEPKPPLALAPSAVHAEKARTDVAAAQAPMVGNGMGTPATLGIAETGRASQPPVPPTLDASHGERVAPAPQSAAAPDISGTGSRIVALSLAPGPNVAPPIGNASAPISIGPHVGHNVSEQAPNISGDGNAGGSLAASAAAPGPAGLLILHESRQPAAPPPPPPVVAATAPVIAKPQPKIAPPASFPPRTAILSRRSSTVSSGNSPSPADDLVHSVLGYGQIHTMLVNMPNLTSATGSWVLNFATMPGAQVPIGLVMAPLPVRKVDPEYPPALRMDGVAGEVILYAEIDGSGKVKNIRVIQSVDPQLDHNAAVAFGEWKFLPALFNDKPVSLEVLVHIPFRAAPTPAR